MPGGDKPPFRADHVGSLLRPAALKEARVRLLGPDTAESNLGPHGNEELASHRGRLRPRCHRAPETRGAAFRHGWGVPPP